MHEEFELNKNIWLQRIKDDTRCNEACMWPNCSKDRTDYAWGCGLVMEESWHEADTVCGNWLFEGLDKLCKRMCLSWWVKLNINRGPWILELQGSKWVEGMWNVPPNWGNKANSSSNSLSDCFWYMIVIFSLFCLIHIYVHVFLLVNAMRWTLFSHFQFTIW